MRVATLYTCNHLQLSVERADTGENVLLYGYDQKAMDAWRLRNVAQDIGHLQRLMKDHRVFDKTGLIIPGPSTPQLNHHEGGDDATGSLPTPQ